MTSERKKGSHPLSRGSVLMLKGSGKFLGSLSYLHMTQLLVRESDHVTVT